MTAASDEFYARCKSIMKAAGGGFIIYAKPDPADEVRNQIAADKWLAYLASKGLDKTAAVWRQILSGGGKAITVPFEDPELFETGYVNPYPVPRWNPPPVIRARGNVSQQVERAKQSMRAYKPKREKWEPVPEPLVSPHEWLAQQEANPDPIPMLSDAMREKLGLPPIDIVPDVDRYAAE